MEDLQTTVDEGETPLVFSESEAGETEKGTKKDRKELFQINTHPATVITANNKRDRRLKQIVMRVVAFCKKEHEEGQQIPFRFFKKRASLMTGVSLSTIHRIETIDMKESPSSPDPESSPGKAMKPRKEGQKKKVKKKKKVEREGSSRGGEAATQASVMSLMPPQPNMVDGYHNGPHVHFQVPTLPSAVTAEPPAKPPAKKKKKKKVNKETESPLPTGADHHHHGHSINTPSTTPPTFMTLQPAAAVLHAVSTGEGMVTTINVQPGNPVVGCNPAATHQQRAAPCAWTTTGPIGPFTMGELRTDAMGGHQVQIPAASHLQVNAAQHMQAVAGSAAAIPVGAQLQPISVAVSQQAGFVGQVEGSQVNWAPGSMGAAAFGTTLPTTATLVGQQVVQTYPNHPPGQVPPVVPGPPGHHTLAVSTPSQQQPQHSSVFYHF